MASGEINPISLLLQAGLTNHALLEFLLQNKANPNLVGKGVKAEQPIVLATAKGDFRAVDLLLAHRGLTEFECKSIADAQRTKPLSRNR